MAAGSVATTQKAILDAIVARLRDQVSDFNSTTLTLVATAEQADQSSKRNHIWGAVLPMQGSFDDAEFTGGGHHSLVEHTGATVILFTNRRTDQAGHAEGWMSDSAEGLLELKRLVLKALTKWVPVNGSSERIVINALQPIHSDPPQKANGEKVGDLALTFSTDFEWDLTT